MKLKKINEEHYVVENNDGVITYSTDINFNEVYYIPLSEVKELLGVVDVYSKKFEYLKKINEEIKHKSQDERIWIYGASDLGFTAGYNQALEDNKEKKYTEEDMRKAIEFGHTSYTPFADVHYSNFIQSLQPKTEWEVEFVDGKLALKK